MTTNLTAGVTPQPTTTVAAGPVRGPARRVAEPGIRKVVYSALLAVVCLLVLVPFVWMISSSLKHDN